MNAVRAYDAGLWSSGRGEAPENGEWRFKRRSASETSAASGCLMLENGWSCDGGGMDAESKRENVVGEAI